MVDLLNRGRMLGHHNFITIALKVLMTATVISGCHLIFREPYTNSSRFYTHHFSANYVLQMGDEEKKIYEMQSKNSEISNGATYIDLDQDGLADAFDADIDGDSILNYLDSHPLDSKMGTLDSDNDGIPDFVDFDSSSLLKKYSDQQASTFLYFGIIVVTDDENSQNNLKTVFENISTFSFIYHDLSKLKIIYLSKDTLPRAAEYNRDWDAIRLFTYKLADAKELNTSLGHELFHVIEAQNPALYDQFLQAGPWEISVNEYGEQLFTYSTMDGNKFSYTADDLIFEHQSIVEVLGSDIVPSFYSLQGPQEHFADSGLATLYLNPHYSELLSGKRFCCLEKFKKSAIFEIFHQYIRWPQDW